MSDDELPAGHTPIDLARECKTAQGGINDFVKDLMAELSKSTASETNKKAVTNALSKALAEASPKPIGAAHLTEAKGAATMHQDHSKVNKLREAEVTGMVVGVVGAVTGNPIAKEISSELATANRARNFEELEKAAKDCGIETVGKNKTPLNFAITSAKKNVETIVGAEFMINKGHPVIYAKPGELNTKNGLQDGIKNFVISCADRLAKHSNNPRNSEDKLEFLERPQLPTAQMRAVAMVTNNKIEPAMTPRRARAFDAAMAQIEILGASSNAILSAFDANAQTEESLASETEAAQEDNNSGMLIPRYANRGVSLPITKTELKKESDKKLSLGMLPLP